jgi:glycine oxidase
MTRTYDVIIVGGGLLGKASALALAEAGCAVAAVYQRARRQGQASAAAGGMLGVFSEVTAHEPMARRRLEVSQRWAARERYHRWIAHLVEVTGCPIELREGLFVIANPVGDDDAAELQAIREAATWHGAGAESVAPRETPGVAAQRGYHPFEAIFLPDEGSVDTAQLLHALDVALDRHPEVTVFDDRAGAVKFEAGGDCAVALTTETLRTQAVVLAGGTEIPHLLAESSLAEVAAPPIFGGRGVSLLVRGPVRFPYAVRTPNRGFACGLHVVPRAAGQVYLGATNRLTTNPDFERGATLGEINNLLQGGVRELNERFNEAELDHVAVGYRPLAVDRLPLVGRTGDPRVLLASGAYRNGVLLAPLVATLIAEEVMTPGLHAEHPYSPRRALAPGGSDELDAWLRMGSRNALTTILEPGGSLPNGREHDLAALFYATFSLLLNPEFDAGGLRGQAQRLLLRAPIEEVIPSLFDLIARQCAQPRIRP